MIQTIGIVSLSRGILGEDFLHHELDLGLARLKEFGVRVKFLPHALDGLESLAAHPEHRAQDLLDAFRDPEIDAILCAIGGDDTYRLAPYLFSNDELKNAVTKKPFLGFSAQPFHAPQGGPSDFLWAGISARRVRTCTGNASLYEAVF